MAAYKIGSKVNLMVRLKPKTRLISVPKRNLNLQEYHSKNLLEKHNVCVQSFRILDSKLDASVLSGFRPKEYVIKAQVLAGGRGKGHFDNGFKGGVHLTKDEKQVLPLAKQMIGHRLITKQTPKNGILVEKIMVAESVNILRETYLSILMEREYNGPVIVASPAGGMDIEAVAEKTPELIMKVPIDIMQGVTDAIANDVAEFLQFKGELKKKAAAEIKKLWQLFVKVDATQLEINPFVETDDGRVVSVDAKINFDDHAEYRQKDLFALNDTSEMDPKEREASALNLVYIDMDGTVACLVNGAGLAMGTMDLITLSGGRPANFLDLGGGVGAKQVQGALKIIESDKKVKSVFVNIFGGIVDCKTIARGLIDTFKTSPPIHPTVVRLEGNNAQEARKMLQEAGLAVHILEDAEKASDLAVKLAKETE